MLLFFRSLTLKMNERTKKEKTPLVIYTTSVCFALQTNGEVDRHMERKIEMDLTLRSGIHSTLLIIGPANGKQIERTGNRERKREKNHSQQKLHTPRERERERRVQR